MRREDLEISCPATQIWSFSGPPTYIQRVDIPEKLPQYFSAMNQNIKGVNQLSLTALHLT